MRNLTCTLIGHVAGFRFYEDPQHGDEAPLMVHMGGSYVTTDFYELPDPWEFQEWLKDYNENS